MLDYVDYEQVKTSSNYEFSVATNIVQNNHAVKKQAYTFMNEFEGFCQKEKASLMIDLIVRIKPLKIVEVGVPGKSLVAMACALKENGKGVIYGIDSLDSMNLGESKQGVNRNLWNFFRSDTVLKGLQAKFTKFGLQNHIQLVQTTSENASPISEIDILHLNGNHTEQSSLSEVKKWVPFMKKNGVIIFNDVNRTTTKMATRYLDQHCIKFKEFKGDVVWGIWVKR